MQNFFYSIFTFFNETLILQISQDASQFFGVSPMPDEVKNSYETFRDAFQKLLNETEAKFLRMSFYEEIGVKEAIEFRELKNAVLLHKKWAEKVWDENICDGIGKNGDFQGKLTRIDVLKQNRKNF